MTEPRIATLVDPALDIESMGADLKPYIETRKESFLKFVPGRRVQWFNLRDITASAWASFVSIGRGASEQRRRAFMVAVASDDNIVDRKGVMRAGTTVGTQRMPTPTGEVMVWSDAEVDQLFAPAIVEDIGEVVRLWAIVPFGCDARLQPPPSSLAALLARVRLRAAELASNLDRNAARKATQEPASSSDGDGPTDATATENPIEPPAVPATP